MAKVYDILIDDNGLVIKNGDLVIGESTLQHQRDLLLTEKGEIKHSPEVGVGLTNFLLDEENPDKISAAITEEFELDGMKINDITEDIVDAEY